MFVNNTLPQIALPPYSLLKIGQSPVANKCLTFLSNLFTDLNFTDVETGYKVFRGEIIRNMAIQSNGFGFEIEVTAKIAKLGCRVYEVPISYYGRTYQEGKKIGFRDGVAAIYYTIKYNLFCSKQQAFPQISSEKVALFTGVQLEDRQA